MKLIDKELGLYQHKTLDYYITKANNYNLFEIIQYSNRSGDMIDYK